MNSADIKKWAVFFAGILCAILVADAISNAIVAVTRLTGPAGLIFSFVLYAVIFFGILYAIEKITGITFFSFSYD
jgi:hypothetical protein